MKKVLLILAAVMMALGAYATEYKGQLSVQIAPLTVDDEEEGDDEEGEEPVEEEEPQAVFQESTITINEHDGLYDLLIKNFVLEAAETQLAVGNINVTDVKASEQFGYKTILFKKSIFIEAGDELPEGASMWLGPYLGEVPLNMTTSFNDDILSVSITISMVGLNQAITVNFIGVNPDAAGQGGGDETDPCDVNGDGTVNVGDVNMVLNAILAE